MKTSMKAKLAVDAGMTVYSDEQKSSYPLRQSEKGRKFGYSLR